MTTALTTRVTAGTGATVKGTPLTNAEIDANFLSLNDNKLETSWTGNTSIVTLGTVATGTWNATTIGTSKGGTGLTSFTSGGAVYATSTSALTTGVLPIASGGTGTSTAPVAGYLHIGTSAGTFQVAPLTGTSNQVIITNGQGSITISTPQDIGTGSNVQHASIGVGTAATGVAGELKATTITETSSITLKENINPIVGALSSIMKLNGVTYDRKDGSRKNEAGLIAEDVALIIPNIVTNDKEGNAEGITYSKITAYLIEAIKELKAEIETLKGN